MDLELHQKYISWKLEQLDNHVPYTELPTFEEWKLEKGVKEHGKPKTRTRKRKK
jgi:hypothetical protein